MVLAKLALAMMRKHTGVLRIHENPWHMGLLPGLSLLCPEKGCGERSQG